MDTYSRAHRVRVGAAVLAVSLACLGVFSISGCGDDEPTSSGVAAPSSDPLTPDDESAISDTIKGWLTEGGCERMTDKFLEAQTFESDPVAACDAFEAIFEAPSYSADDIVVDRFEGTREKATAVVSDEISNVESIYTLLNEDGTWKIEEAGF